MYDLESIGRQSRPGVSAFPAARGKAYAKSTNDPITEHLEGKLLPPVLSYPLAERGQSDGGALRLAVPDGNYGGAVLHGEHDFTWHRPVRPDEIITTTATVVGIHGKASGTSIVIAYDSIDADGNLVVQQTLTTFTLGAAGTGDAGEDAPEHAMPPEVADQSPAAKFTQHVDDDQTWRFAGPSGDFNLIHVDDEAAVQAGLPGVINHGMSTLAMVSHGLITELCAGDPTRLARLAVRFSRPLIPGQDIATSVWAGRDDGRFHFATSDAGGTVVLKDGLVEVRP